MRQPLAQVLRIRRILFYASITYKYQRDVFRGVVRLFVALALGMLSLPAFSGCLGGDGKYLDGPFSIEAPTWKAGYSWVYESRHSSTGEYSDSDGEVHREDDQGSSGFEEVTVFNTTKPAAGIPVYYAWIREMEEYPQTSAPPPGGGYSFSKAFRLYRQSSLQEVGSGYAYYYGLGPAGEGGMNSNIYMNGQEETQPPALEFPLHEGQRWSVEGEAFYDFPMNFSVRVMGQLKLALDDGKHLAVHVRVMGRLTPEDAEEILRDEGPFANDESFIDGHLDVAFVADYYWGIEERNFIKTLTRTDLDYQASARREDGTTFSVKGHGREEHELTLVEHSLSAGAESPVPSSSIQVPGQGYELDEDLQALNRMQLYHRPWDEDALNVADGPIPMTFEVVDRDFFAYDGEPVNPDGEMPLEYNTTRFRPVWTLYRTGYYSEDIEISQVEAATATFILDAPGRFEVEVRFRDLGEDRILSYPRESHGLYIPYEKTVHVDRNPGQSDARMVLTEVPVNYADVSGSIQWDVFSDTPLLYDGGRFVLVDPMGFEQTIGNVGGADAGDTWLWTPGLVGTYRIEWDPDQGISLGDDLEILIELL